MKTNELRVLIADDELTARRRLVRLVDAIPGATLAGECDGSQSLLEWLGRPGGDADALLLDIRMPGLSGLEVAALIPDDSPYVIFTTAHADHAVDAFGLGAIDYLLKPIEAGRLAEALERVRGRLVGEAAGQRALPDRLPVETRAGIVLVDPLELTHALFDGELVTLHTERGDILCDYTLQDLESKLGGGGFVRVHRRALLNLDKVHRFEPLPTGGFVARTVSGAPVPVSRQAARRLRRHLGL
jgi:two-component system LytT family response regulator